MIRIRYAITVNIISLLLISGYYDGLLNNLHAKNFELTNRLTTASHATWGIQEFNVTVTMYNPVRAQTDNTPNETADGTKINPKKASEYRYVALSRDLLKRWGGPFDYGEFITIRGTGIHDGVYQVKDTMNPRYINRVDILKTMGSPQFKYSDVTLCKYNKYHDGDELAFND